VHCLRAFRSSVLSNVPPRGHGEEDGLVPSLCLWRSSSGGLGGRSQRARAVRASDHDGVWS
jgi:hypothetical protein